MWSQCEGAANMKLWQIQMEHAARPFCLFDIRGSFNDFLQQAARDKSDDFPKTLEDLSKASIRLVVADSNDPDAVGLG